MTRTAKPRGQRRQTIVRSAGIAVIGATLALGLAACNDTSEPESNVSAAPAAADGAPSATAAPAGSERLPAATETAPTTPVE